MKSQFVLAMLWADMADGSDLSWCIPTLPSFHPYQPLLITADFNNFAGVHLSTPPPFVMPDIQPDVFASAHIIRNKMAL